ncbi:hypothetical protein PMAYCL1PPCAC_19236, partial [Pristionchus mayeri]
VVTIRRIGTMSDSERSNTNAEEPERNDQTTTDGDVAGSSVSSTTRSSSRLSSSASAIEQRDLRSSNATAVVDASSPIGSPSSKRTRKQRVSYTPVVATPKQASLRSAKRSTGEDNEQEDQPTSSRASRPKRTSTAGTPTATIKKVPNSAKRKSSGDADVQGEKRIRGESSGSLELTLIETILLKPFFVNGSGGAASITSDEVPVNVLKSDKLPGMEIWNEQTYVDSGYSLDKKTSLVEVFADREVDRVVAYVLHKPNPYILVKLAMKKNETTVRVKDVVLAVNCPLATRLFPKAFETYMTRMATPNLPAGAGTQDGPSGSGMGAGTDDGPGGSGPSPYGRPSRRSKI